MLELLGKPRQCATKKNQELTRLGRARKGLAPQRNAAESIRPVKPCYTSGRAERSGYIHV